MTEETLGNLVVTGTPERTTALPVLTARGHPLTTSNLVAIANLFCDPTFIPNRPSAMHAMTQLILLNYSHAFAYPST